MRMTTSTQDFAYWLQGYFEIAGNDTALSVSQAKKIKSKIDELGSTQGSGFERFIGAAEAVSNLLSQSGLTDDVRKAQTAFLQNALNELFVHDIDPSYDGDQQQFNDIHQGNPKPPNNPNVIARC